MNGSVNNNATPILASNTEFHLPLHIWERILLEAVVLRVLDGTSLYEALGKVASVCQQWLQLVKSNWFQRHVGQLLWKRDPGCRYLSNPKEWSCGGVNFSQAEMMTLLGNELYVMTADNNYSMQVWDFASPGVGDSVVFQFIRQMSLDTRFVYRQPDVLVACPHHRRLFLHDDGGPAPNSYICRINPTDGNVEAIWIVGKDCYSVVTGGGKFVLGYSDRLEVRDVTGNGEILTTVPVNPPTPNSWLDDAFPLPGNDGHYLVCFRSSPDGSGPQSGHIATIRSDGQVLASCLLDNSVHFYSCAVDPVGFVLLITSSAVDGETTDCRLLRQSSLQQQRILFSTRHRHTVRQTRDETQWSTKEMWLDFGRGLLFVWTRNKSLQIHRVLDTV